MTGRSRGPRAWDNRRCVRQAFNDYDGFRRELYRTTIAGEVPVLGRRFDLPFPRSGTGGPFADPGESRGKSAWWRGRAARTEP